MLRCSPGNSRERLYVIREFQCNVGCLTGLNCLNILYLFFEFINKVVLKVTGDSSK